MKILMSDRQEQSIIAYSYLIKESLGNVADTLTRLKNTTQPTRSDNTILTLINCRNAIDDLINNLALGNM